VSIVGQRIQEQVRQLLAGQVIRQRSNSRREYDPIGIDSMRLRRTAQIGCRAVIGPRS
jgi:hypothetical protein